MAAKKKKGVGLPKMEEGMNKLPPKSGDDSEKDSRQMFEDDVEQANAQAKSKRQRLEEDQKILTRAVKRYKRGVERESDNRSRALEDLKFKAGEQWPADIAADRKRKRRPCLTINSAPTLTHQITNDIRQNRPAINVSPMGDLATKESAELMASRIRAVERDSLAEIAYDTAVQYQVDIGFGYWRFITEWENEKSLDQVPVIKRITNPFSVVLDADRQQPDGSDSKWGFISEMMERSEFKESYPDAQLINWREAAIGDDMKLWATKDEMRVAEYFEITYEKKRLVELDTGYLGWYEDLDDSVKGDISSGKTKILDERQSEEPTVMWYKMTAVEILERKLWVGKWVPIIEVVGDELNIEGKVIKSGVIRHAKDPMRMKNYWVTVKTELIALQPKNPYVGAEGQFEGYEDTWERSGKDNLAYLEYALVTDDAGNALPPPKREAPPGIPGGMIQAEESAEQDILRTTGIRFDASKQERTFDESGKALRELRRNSDIGSYHYVDNFGLSLRHSGRVLMDLLIKLSTRKKTVTALGVDGKESNIVIDPDHSSPIGQISPRSKSPIKVLNPTLGEYGVTITIGPSYATKRIEASEQMMQFLAKVPETMRGAVATLLAKYSDWPGATELYRVLLKMSPPGVFDPDPTNIPPEAAAIIKGLQAQMQRLMAERTQMIKDLNDQRGDRAVMVEKINRDFEVKLLKIIADLTKFDKKHSLEIAQSMATYLQDLTSEALPAGNTGQGGAISTPPKSMGA